MDHEPLPNLFVQVWQTMRRHWLFILFVSCVQMIPLRSLFADLLVWVLVVYLCQWIVQSGGGTTQSTAIHRLRARPALRHALSLAKFAPICMAALAIVFIGAGFTNDAYFELSEGSYADCIVGAPLADCPEADRQQMALSALAFAGHLILWATALFSVAGIVMSRIVAGQKVFRWATMQTIVRGAPSVALQLFIPIIVIVMIMGVGLSTAFSPLPVDWALVDEASDIPFTFTYHSEIAFVLTFVERVLLTLAHMTAAVIVYRACVRYSPVAA